MLLFSINAVAQTTEKKLTFPISILLSKSFDGLENRNGSLNTINRKKSYSFGTIASIEYKVLKHFNFNAGVQFRYYTESKQNSLRYMAKLKYIFNESIDSYYIGLGWYDSILNQGNFKLGPEFEILIGRKILLKPNVLFVELNANFSSLIDARNYKEATNNNVPKSSYQDIGFKIGIVFD